MHPLEAAQAVSEPYWALLYSGTSDGRYSFLAHRLKEKIESDDLSKLETALLDKTKPFEQRWFGFLGYDLKHSLEKLLPQAPHCFHLPNVLMMRFEHVYVFDHHTQTLTRHTYKQDEHPLKPVGMAQHQVAQIKHLSSNMSKQEYLTKAALIIDRIQNGKLYQANLTRKFTGNWNTAPHSFSIFTKLCEISPASYSTYLQLGDVQILSSSPELFLRIESSGYMESMPIKGSARRNTNPSEDEKLRAGLQKSEKDKAENLMIVDLMRHDFSRSCVAGSVVVDRLFELKSHPTIHHLSSRIRGQMAPSCRTLDAIKACFPPGSMTGAPKISAMNLCTELERDARGIYAGTIGWLDGDGSAELSVVIRTLLIRGNQFEFQVGGGIVADSEPEKEWDETLAKARAIAQTLGITEEQLACL
ncbi:MAG: aminodeoxychorismate synthase component I [Rickettsiales bacterium]|nr:aminodeoxychorismate synthase component I [Rickettsiales bacterium]